MDKAIINNLINTEDRCFIMGAAGSRPRAMLGVTAISALFLAFGWLMHYTEMQRHLIR